MKQQSIYKSEEGRKKILEHYESYLKSFDTIIERVYVKTRFGKTHMLVAGPEDGKPVFILQGGNCINPMTLSWFTSLFKTYRIYAADTIGHPGYSDETRISPKDESFPLWISDLMNHFNVNKSAFIGASYGAGIILRMAAYMPDKIACSVLVSPSGIKIGSKSKLMKKVVLPFLIYKARSSENQLKKITDVMSINSMKEEDKQIIWEIIKHVKLEKEMPKLLTKAELANSPSPTMIIAGIKDIFFPEELVLKKAKEIIPNLPVFYSYNMGHFPSEKFIIKINDNAEEFLSLYY
ncbi:alpha/beta fold hydrolase [Domibacillus epiphyticus]|uniref:Alpha/beta hydrolase n=1 Tax=Domibacillus epiphyticus TaxID=1714355 RepID=A0A1V2AB52_9BACI|nr:alpha/beta fold hydrolase [Domibacillus epiphyticus]OMP68225.1 alpha/beta hydrolase [Domibacillus epiphyticus]